MKQILTVPEVAVPLPEGMVRDDMTPERALYEMYDLWASGALDERNLAYSFEEAMGHVARLLNVDTGDVPVTSPLCKHPLDECRLVEDGYQRRWYTEIDEDAKVIRASYGGSSDFTDEGEGGEYLQCGICLASRPVPDDYEIDWR